MSNFRVTSPQETADETKRYLCDIDTELGTALAAVFDASQQLNPDLGKVFVDVLDDDELAERGLTPDPSLYTNNETMDIVLPARFDHYDMLVDGVLSGRMQTHQQIIRQTRGAFSHVDAINISAAHEFGHADLNVKQFAELGYEAACQQQNEADARQLWGLPLCMPTSDAWACWQSNKGGYRTSLERSGIDEQAFQRLLVENIAAYGQLPEEAHADDFALEVVRIVYV